MLAECQTYPMWTQNFIQIGTSVTMDFSSKHRDKRILYIRLFKEELTIISQYKILYKQIYYRTSISSNPWSSNLLKYEFENRLSFLFRAIIY